MTEIQTTEIRTMPKSKQKCLPFPDLRLRDFYPKSEQKRSVLGQSEIQMKTFGFALSEIWTRVFPDFGALLYCISIDVSITRWRYWKDVFSVCTVAKCNHWALAFCHFGVITTRRVSVLWILLLMFVFTRQGSFDGLDYFWRRLSSLRLDFRRSETRLAWAQKFPSLFCEHLIKISQKRNSAKRN